jgi:ATP-dependent DNA helicase RecG
MDPEILRLSERLSIAIELGESHFQEFKSALEGPPSGKKARDPKDAKQSNEGVWFRGI